eukprot:bmy_10049T0
MFFQLLTTPISCFSSAIPQHPSYTKGSSTFRESLGGSSPQEKAQFYTYNDTSGQASLQDSGGPAAPAPRLPTRPPAPARLYHKKVVDHYENPQKVGFLDKTSKNNGGAPACSDVMKLQIQADEKRKMVNGRFKTFGCGSAIASSSSAN